MRRQTLILLVAITLFSGMETLFGQVGRGNRFGSRYGRGQSTVPQAQSAPKPPEPKTAEELVEERMPSISEALALDPFEEAVVRTTLVKYVQQRIELGILELEPDKMKEELEKISKNQDADIKAGLPPEKYESYMELQKNNFDTRKLKKKKKKKSKKD
ncbi:hypothetical protein [Flagellimonas allohymeniacidonis]|uniref:Uncharacterized protein n=1 Tax=Flagellimonas allohymeniacidonis TaxID=2517819 RepID=A0A4Q8QDV7_9FLAO|nr:hypothetical protein [Allomuricauda hymeniacidonis]TAI48662.1 hypothetical protein EW142_02355 [Allomuricauda hymeniacidonis]